MMMQKASRKKAKIRLGLSSVSGGGKTYSALLIAKGLANGDLSKVAVIDSENGSADLYADLGPYQVIHLAPPFSPERYIEAISACLSGGMEVIILDSISHEWEGKGGVLELADAMGGQYQSAWKTLTPRHESFKQAILQSPCHMITTVRRKQDYVLQEKVNKSGKTVQAPVKVGLKEVTREGWEYELTINLELELNHYATASKDRTGLFMGKPAFVPSEETGRQIAAWCNEGVEPLNIAQRVGECKSMAELLALFQSTDINNEDTLQIFKSRKEDLLNLKSNGVASF
ncbi:MAG: AAA family ATPase [Chitinophagaceae bacterium]